MIILSYDIKEDSLRTEFSKFILQYGRRLQYSVYEIRNSKRLLEIIKLEIKDKFEDKFTQSDSVFIFEIKNNDDIIRFGYAKNEENDLVIV
jgi:CRISPR-associated protein Cas2